MKTKLSPTQCAHVNLWADDVSVVAERLRTLALLLPQGSEARRNLWDAADALDDAQGDMRRTLDLQGAPSHNRRRVVVP